MSDLGRGATQKMINDWWGDSRPVDFCECGQIADYVCSNCGEHICIEHSAKYSTHSRMCLDCIKDYGGIDE